ncbi:MAG: tetratricopeptide repeat protein [Desulfobacteraceae bacterium]|nr:tetratricopeptide repeat protein [Desulfobacteraceae bacterium]
MKQPSRPEFFPITAPMVIIFIFIGFIFFPTLENAWAANINKDRLPPAVSIWVTDAQRLFQNGKITEAVTLLEKYKKKKKNNNIHYYVPFLLGNYYLFLAEQDNQNKKNKNFIQNAIRNYRASVEKNPGFYAGWLNLAKSLYESDHFTRAAIAFEKGYETSHPTKPIHLYYAAICYFQADTPEKALAVFERLRSTHPDKISLAWKESLVNILFSMERYSQALPTLEELAAKTKNKKKWQEILLYQYFSLKMKEKALTFANFLTRQDPLEPKWWKALCHIQLNNNNLLEGLSSLIIYGYLTPMTQKELTLAGDLYLTLDVPGTAAQLYENCLEKTPAPKTILKISQAYLMAHDQDKALDWIKKGLSTSRNIKLLNLKAQILYGQKKYARAAQAYEELAEKMIYRAHNSTNNAPDMLGQTWLMVGYATMGQDKPDTTQLNRAKKAFLKAANFKKQKKAARRALEQIKAN